jgi:hypothetical protein
MPSKEISDKFKNLYQKQFSVMLTDEEATKMATDLLNLMRVLIRPIPKQNNNKTYFEGEK